MTKHLSRVLICLTAVTLAACGGKNPVGPGPGPTPPPPVAEIEIRILELTPVSGTTVNFGGTADRRGEVWYRGPRVLPPPPVQFRLWLVTCLSVDGINCVNLQEGSDLVTLAASGEGTDSYIRPSISRQSGISRTNYVIAMIAEVDTTGPLALVTRIRKQVAREWVLFHK